MLYMESEKLTTTVCFRLSESLLKWLQKTAKEKRRKLGSLIRTKLEESKDAEAK